MTAGRRQGGADVPDGPPDLVGIVLAGGFSRRMGRDKGEIAFRGRPQADRAASLLRPFTGSVRVSVRQDQATQAAYRGLRPVVDIDGVAGPAAGLLAAWQAHPGAALLVLAVDMPLVDAATIDRLVARRAPGCLATAYRHPDGTPEPLCAIWEPGAEPLIRAAAFPAPAPTPTSAPAPAPAPTSARTLTPPTAEGPSLRRILESASVAWLDAPDTTRLVSLNTPEALAAAEMQESNSSH